MSVSSISTSSSFAVSSQQRPQRPNDEISSGVDSLLKAVQSGDKDSIQSAYDSLSSTVNAKNSSTSSSSTSSSTSTDSNNPISKLLSTVGDALKSGDVSNLASTLQAQGPGGAGGPGGPGGAGGPPPGGPPPGGGQGGPSDDVKTAIGSLAESLSSGNLSSAQDSYSTLADLLSDETDSTSSSSSSSSSSANDKFTSTLSNIGSALESGNLSQAQQLFSSLLPRGSSMNVYA